MKLILLLPGTELYERNLRLLVPFFDNPTIQLNDIEKVLLLCAILGKPNKNDNLLVWNFILLKLSFEILDFFFPLSHFSKL